MYRIGRRGFAALLFGSLLAGAIPSHAVTIVLDGSTGADYDAVGDGWFFTTPPNQPPDGVGDLGGNNLAIAYESGVVELRAMAEFPLAPLAGFGAGDLVSATLTYTIDDVVGTFGPGTTFDGTASDPIAVYTYPADGTIAVADFNPPGASQLAIVATGLITDASLAITGPIDFQVDATQRVKDFLTANQTHLGVLFGTIDTPTGTSLDGVLPYVTIELTDPTTTTTSSTTTTTTEAPTTTTTEASTTTTTTLLSLVGHPQEAHKLGLKAKSGKEGLLWISKTPPPAFPSADPTVAGGTLQVRNPVTLESGSASLPAAGWTKNNAGTVYKFKNGSAPGGSSIVKVAVLKEGKLLKVSAKGTGITLDEPTQGSIEVSLTIGTDRYCSVCSAPSKDSGGAGPEGKFLAKGCSAPTSCSGL